MATSFRWMRLFVFITSFSAGTDCSFTEDDIGLSHELENIGLQAQATYAKSLFEYTGCFWIPRVKPHNVTINSIQNCSSKCGIDTKKIGIKLNICICLKAEDNFTAVGNETCEKEYGWADAVYYHVYQQKIDGTTTETSKENKTLTELFKKSSFMTTAKSSTDRRDKQTTVYFKNVTTESFMPSVSIVEETTHEYNTTTNAFLDDFDGETSIFILQIVLVIALSIIVVAGAIFARYLSRPKRRKYSFPKDNNGDLTVGEEKLNCRVFLADNYTNPWDEKLFKDRQHEQTTANYPTTENSSEELENTYQHLDFTMRKDKSPKFLNDSEYGYGRSNAISVFDQPWDASTSKMTRLFSHIRQTVVQGGRDLRDSIFKPNCEDHNGSIRDSNRDNDTNGENLINNGNGNIAREISSSLALRCKHKDNSETVDRSFEVLPFSERIEVSSTNVYAEPEECRKSLRDRLLHIVSVKPFRFDFGTDSGGLYYSNRRTRCKSKIYSLSKPIQEIDESEV